VVNRLGKALEVPINLLMWAACFVGFMMMTHITVDVIGRVVFNHPLDGTIEIVSGYYMVAVAFLPLAYISRHEGQIIVELFTRGLTGRKLVRLEILVNIVTIAYLSVFAWMTGTMAVEQTVEGEVWETATGFLDVWPSRWVLPLSVFVMVLYLLFRIIVDLRKAEP
jgi:TRAP-type C4-dicarboxylate transport system permease small subunit